MCGFSRRYSKFGITLSLGVLAVALRQISDRAELLSFNTQPGGASGESQSSYCEAPSLALGESINREFPGSASDAYKITLGSRQYLRIAINPWGIEMGLTLYAPDGQKLSEIVCRQNGPTSISVIAEVSGTYGLEFRSLEKDPAQGRYELRVEEIRPANALDIHRIAGEKAFAKADELRNEWKAESSRQAIKRYKEALQHWRTAGEQLQRPLASETLGRSIICWVSHGQHLTTTNRRSYS